jgi:hypothetical protein
MGLIVGYRWQRSIWPADMVVPAIRRWVLGFAVGEDERLRRRGVESVDLRNGSDWYIDSTTASGDGTMPMDSILSLLSSLGLVRLTSP